MTYKYQLIILGNYNVYKQDVIDSFFTQARELGLETEAFVLLNEMSFEKQYQARNPSVCVYFSNGGIFPHTDIVKRLITDAVFLIPVVTDLSQYKSLTPQELHFINGTELIDSSGINAITNKLLEGLSLLRRSRRLFISYRRVESRAIAIQLYEHLDQKGFDVFLDTHSLQAGDYFQDELWHRMVDADVVVLLDTPGFLESYWTEQELAKASGMGICILQVIWPGHQQAQYSALCTPLYLKQADFENGITKSELATLNFDALARIASDTESLRARSLAGRQDNLIEEFTATATAHNISTYLQPEKFLILTNKNGQDVALIPTVGVPQSFTFSDVQELIKRIRNSDMAQIYILYDHRNIVGKWETHLGWLNTHLPVKARRIVEVESWIENL